MKIRLKLFKELKGKYVVRSNISKHSYLSSGTIFYNSSIDKYSYVGYDCEIIKTSIGKFCSISNQVIIGGASHPLDFVSTSPVFLNGNNCLKSNIANHDYYPYKETIIENDVWIGERVIVLAGNKLCNGCVVGAGSVVTHDIPPYEIWAGNPARFIRKRFSDDIINKLLASKWWDYDIAKMKELSLYFHDPTLFLEKIK